jgi:hypothetical protein
MSTHSTLHSDSSSPARRHLTWNFRNAVPSPRGGWDAVAEITDPVPYAGLQQWGHGATPEEARADLRRQVDAYEALVGGDL